MIAQDSSAGFDQYARPEKLVSTDWLAEHLDDPGLVVVESDEDALLYYVEPHPWLGQGRLAHGTQ